jgi:non-lysosomal glucosylceramidase
MAWEGMLTEALAICRGVHERYHPAKHNPWNEIECGDHYARALASWGVLTGLSGFEYHGPARHIGFAPRITPDDFCCVFTAAEGWGTLTQTRRERDQTNAIAVRWGRLPVETVAVELPEGATLRNVSVAVGDQEIAATASQAGRRVTVTLPAGSVVAAGSVLRVETSW